MRPASLASLLLVVFSSSVSSGAFYNDSQPSCDVSSDFSSSSSIVKQLVVNAIAISEMEAKLENLRGRLEKAKQIDPLRIYREIEARAVRLKAPTCASDQFECMPRAGECVYDLFVCDGRKDCTNGYDEDEEVCSASPVMAGLTYIGWSHWTSCENRADHQTNITIIGYRIRKYSTSLVWLKALIESSFNKDERQVPSSHTAKGHYKFANREMVLLGEGSGRTYASFCQFNKGNYKQAECKLVKVSSLDHCATIHLVLDE